MKFLPTLYLPVVVIHQLNGPSQGIRDSVLLAKVKSEEKSQGKKCKYFITDCEHTCELFCKDKETRRSLRNKNICMLQCIWYKCECLLHTIVIVLWGLGTPRYRRNSVTSHFEWQVVISLVPCTKIP